VGKLRWRKLLNCKWLRRFSGEMGPKNGGEEFENFWPESCKCRGINEIFFCCGLGLSPRCCDGLRAVAGGECG